VLKKFAKYFFFKIIDLIPKNNKVLVFGDRAGIRFADNSRYLFFYLSKYHKEFKCIWITKEKEIFNYLNNKGFKCFFSGSFKGIYYTLIAKYHLYNFVENDINKYLTYFSNNILLWHGVLPKKLEEATNNLEKNFVNKKLKKYFLYPNSQMAINILNHFQEKKFDLFVSNLPRNILLKKDELDKNYFLTDQEIKFKDQLSKERKKIIGYFPTWRVDGIELFKDVKELSELKKLDDFLDQINSLLLIKKHMNSEKKDNNRHYNKEIEKTTNYISDLKNIRNVNFEFDLNSLLDNCDVLVSDYSGVIFDYLYLDRPIIIYAPDYNDFIKYNGFNLDPIKENFCHVAYSIHELKKLFEEYFEDQVKFKEKFSEQRIKIKNKIFQEKAGLKNLIDLIKK